MTRKDLTLIASALADAHTQIRANPYIADQLSAMAGHRLSCEALADVLRTTNPRFDRDRFLQECATQECTTHD